MNELILFRCEEDFVSASSVQIAVVCLNQCATVDFHEESVSQQSDIINKDACVKSLIAIIA